MLTRTIPHFTCSLHASLFFIPSLSITLEHQPLPSILHSLLPISTSTFHSSLYTIPPSNSSVGIECVDDLIADLKQALDKIWEYYMYTI